MNINISKFGLLALACAAASFAFADRESIIPTQHRYASNISEAVIDSYVDDGYRMHDIEIVSTNPLRYAGSFVKNEGDYEKAWWWTADKTLAGLKQFAADRNARPIDIELTIVNGQRRFAGTFIQNSGGDQVNWKIYDDISFDQLKTDLGNYNGRATDLDVRLDGKIRKFTGVMIKNTGAFAKPFFIFSNKGRGAMNAFINQTGFQLTDLERISSNRYAGILQASNARWSYNVDQSFDEMSLDQAQQGSRIIDLESYVVNGVPQFSYVLISNTNELEERIGNIMRSATNGVSGFYLRQVGGQTLGEMLPDYRFYPASTIKVLQHLYWSKRVEDGVSPLAQVRIYANSVADTHPPGSIFFLQTLQQTQRNMMLNSVNADTNALQDLAGNNNGINGRGMINNYKTFQVGLGDNFELNTKLGAGGPSNPNPNVGNLREFGELYDKATNGSLLNATGLAYFRSNMLNETNNSGVAAGVRNVISQEGIALGLPSSTRNAFWLATRCLWKPGSFTIGGVRYSSSAGSVQLPFKNRLGGISMRTYVLGAFFDEFTTVDPAFGGTNGFLMPEILREEIRKAMITW